MKTVGIIGCGAICTLIAEAIENRTVPADRILLFDVSRAKAEKLKKALRLPVVIVDSVDDMIKLKPSVIVEAASEQAAKDYVQKIVDANIEVIVMSVGALLDVNVRSSKVHIPSGAIGGLDALSSANLAGVYKVTLTTRKNPRTLDMRNQEEQLVYEGGPKEAVKRFPREMNVAATLALTVQPEKVRVQVISDPKVQRNVHEITVKWKHGDMLLRFSNEPHPKNPKTSALAAWSAVELLKEVLESPS